MNFIFYPFLAILVFTQWAFAGVHVWAYTLMQLSIFTLSAGLLLAAAFSLLWPKNNDGPFVSPGFAGAQAAARNWLPFLFFLLLPLVWGAIQMAPLPLWLTQLLSPALAELHQTLNIVTAVDPVSRLPLSSVPFLTRLEWLKLLAYACALLITLICVDSRRRLRTLCWVLVGMGLFQVIYGMTQTFSVDQKIWWWSMRELVNGYYGFLTGTYISRNHLAGFLELVTPLCLGLGLAKWLKARPVPGMSMKTPAHPRTRASGRRKKGHRSPQRGGPREWRPLLHEWLTAMSRKAIPLSILFGGVVLGLGLLLTACRSGVVALTLSLVIMAILFFLRPGFRRLGLVVTGAGLLIFAYGVNVGLDQTAQRFENLAEGFDGRLEIYRDVWPMLADFPWSGSGLGSFGEAYHPYTSKFGGRVELIYAHNDWLQWAIENGRVSFVVMLGGYLWFLFVTIRQWFRRRDPLAVGIGAGMITALLAIGIHSLTDFNMHIPANALSVAVVVGLGWRALFMKKHRARSSAPRRLDAQSRGTALAMIGAMLLVLGLAAYWSLNHFIAETLCGTERNSILHRDPRPPENKVRLAIARDPQNPKYYAKLAGHLGGLRASLPDDSVLRELLLAEALANWEAALRRNPFSGDYWYQYGAALAGSRAGQRRLPRADLAMETARTMRPNDAQLLFRIGRYWLLRWAKAEDLDRPSLQARIQDTWRRSLEISPSYWQTIAETAWEQGWDEKLLTELAPENRPFLRNRFKKWVAKRETASGKLKAES